MKGDAKVIEFLNKALLNELTAINQYWLHYRVLDNWGLKKLAAYERHESIEEMEHADKLAERILFLEALPNFQAIHKLKVGETVGDAGALPDPYRPSEIADALCEAGRFGQRRRLRHPHQFERQVAIDDRTWFRGRSRHGSPPAPGSR